MARTKQTARKAGGFGGGFGGGGFGAAGGGALFGGLATAAGEAPFEEYNVDTFDDDLAEDALDFDLEFIAEQARSSHYGDSPGSSAVKAKITTQFAQKTLDFRTGVLPDGVEVLTVMAAMVADLTGIGEWRLQI